MVAEIPAGYAETARVNQVLDNFFPKFARVEYKNSHKGRVKKMFIKNKILFQNEYIYDEYNYRIRYSITWKRILYLKKEIARYPYNF